MAPKTEVIEQLQAKNAEIAAEVERLKATPPNQRQDLHCVVSDISAECRELRQQLAIAEEHNARLTSDRGLLLEAYDYGQFADDFNQPQAKSVRAAICKLCEALSIPASREALDKYVAEKVKELEDQVLSANNLLAVMHRDGGHHVFAVGFDQAVQDAMAIYYELTKQRDLAVSAIENLVKQKGRHNTEIAYKKLVEALAAIKESEE